MEKIGDFWVPSVDALWGRNRAKTKSSYAEGGRGKQIAHLEEALKILAGHGDPGLRKSQQAIDAGANVGAWARRLAEEFAVVHAFEPADDTYACLERNVADWQLGTKIRTYQNALSFQREKVGVKSGLLRRSTTRAISRGGDIEAIPLDELSLENVGFFKIDVEGYEENVLRGATALLASSRPFVLMEVKAKQNRKYGDPMGSHDFLLSQGYELIAKIGDRQIDWLYKPAG